MTVLVALPTCAVCSLVVETPEGSLRATAVDAGTCPIEVEPPSQLDSQAGVLVLPVI